MNIKYIIKYKPEIFLTFFPSSHTKRVTMRQYNLLGFLFQSVPVRVWKLKLGLESMFSIVPSAFGHLVD